MFFNNKLKMNLHYFSLGQMSFEEFHSLLNEIKEDPDLDEELQEMEISTLDVSPQELGEGPSLQGAITASTDAG